MAKELSCGVDFMRGVLLFLNVLFIIIGLALIGVGIYIKVDTNFASILNDIGADSSLDAQSLGFLGYIMIGGGVATLLIALFGCAGTLWHNRCLLYMYAFILFSLMVAEFVAFIMAFVYKSKLQEVYEQTLLTVLEDGLEKDRTTIIDSFHQLEKLLDCCGVRNVSDYAEHPSQIQEICRGTNKIGCGDKIVQILNNNLPIVAGVLGGVLALELITFIGSIVLAVALKHAPDTYSSNPKEVFKGMRG